MTRNDGSTVDVRLDAAVGLVVIEEDSLSALRERHEAEQGTHCPPG